MFQSRPTQSDTARRRLRFVGGGLALAVAFMLVPTGITDTVRTPLSALLVPAQHGLATLSRAGAQTLVALRAQFTRTEQAVHREVENKRLSEENRRLKAELRATRGQVRLLVEREPRDPPLLATKCVPARILGIPAQAYLARHRLLDAGRSRGVELDAPVLWSAAPLVDRGHHAGVENGDVVLAGSCLWGKISSVGRHTSTVCPITEPGYRDLVRLAAASGDGSTLRLGARGILEGTGQSLARLRMVETTEPVSVGDLVYSMAGQGFVEMPLLCGRVARVERPPGAGHWDIWVASAIDDVPDDLVILCPTVALSESLELAVRPNASGDAAVRSE